MTPAYAAKLGLIIKKTNIGTQKLYYLSLKTYKMAIAEFLLKIG